MTWGLVLDGKQFYEAFRKIGCKIDKTNVVCEIGPGYGRIFDTFKEKFSFKKWYMVEINPKRCENLKQKYKNDSRVVVLCQNVDFLELPEKFDVGISTLTFKHLYPDCSIALFNVSRYIDQEGFFVFDIFISDRERIFFEKQGNIVNYYSEDTLEEFIRLAGLVIKEKGVVHYPMGLRSLYCLGKRKLPLSILKRNQLNRKILSLERHRSVLEEHIVNLEERIVNLEDRAKIVKNELHDIKKSFPYRVTQRIRKIIRSG